MRAIGKIIKKLLTQYPFLCLGVIAALLGLYGFGAFANLDLNLVFSGQGWLNFFSEKNWANFFTAALKTAQLFVLNLSASEIGNWQAALAAFLAPLSTIGAVLSAFGHKFKHWLQLQNLSFKRGQADYVFIGGGHHAVGLAARLHKQAKAQGKKLKIVGLDKSEDNLLSHLINIDRVSGFSHVGDCFVDAEIANLRLHKAKKIFVSIGGDLENINAARRVLSVINHQQDAARVYVHVRDHHLVRARDVLFPKIGDQITLEMVSINRLAARHVLLKFPPKPAQKNTPPHLLIVGASELAEAILIHAVQHLVYSVDQPLKVTWAGLEVSEKLQALRKKFIGLNETNGDPAIKALLPLVKIQTIDCDADELCPHQWREAQNAYGLFNIVYIACLQDDLTYTAAKRIATLREIGPKIIGEMPIVACFQESQGSISDLIDEQLIANKSHLLPLQNGQNIHDLYGINIFNLFVNLSENYLGEHKDFNAMLLNGVYSNAHKKPTNPEMQASDEDFIKNAQKKWEEAGEPFKWSSRLSADHINIKLQCIAFEDYQLCKLVNNPEDLKFSIEQNIVKLAKLEHRRFIAERLMEGWLPININHTNDSKDADYRYKPIAYKQAQKNQLSLNYTLVPFEQLNEIDKQKATPQPSEEEKDYGIVRAIPLILRCEAIVKLVN